MVTDWKTPIRRVERHEMWCVWAHDGSYEWMVHPDMAADLLVTGIKVDGEWCPVEKLGEWPGIGAWQIRAQKHSVLARKGFREVA